MEIQAEVEYWNDFSYAFYRKLLTVCAQRHAILPLRAFTGPSAKNSPRIHLRHDLDVCLSAAIEMAEQEVDLGISATYMVIPTSLLYSIRGREGRGRVRRLQKLGHEIAIHFDFSTSGIGSTDDVGAIEDAVTTQCAMISDITGEPVSSISFHRPIPTFLHGPDILFGMVNAYSATLMRAYHADSRGHWRHGNPVSVFENQELPVAQLLVHPIWWGSAHESPPHRVENFFQRAAKGMNRKMAQDLDQKLADTRLDVPRAGLL